MAEDMNPVHAADDCSGNRLEDPANLGHDVANRIFSVG